MHSLEVGGWRPARDGGVKTFFRRNQECNWACLARYQRWKQTQQAGEIAQWKHVGAEKGRQKNVDTSLQEQTI